jgi:hypothetical protein
MENHLPQETVKSISTDIFSSVKSLIGFNRYSFLKSLSEEDLSDDEKQQIVNYEEKHIPTPEQLEKQFNYNKKIRERDIKTEKKFTKKELWIAFRKHKAFDVLFS